MLEKTALDQLFNDARTYSHWQNKPIAKTTLKQLYELTRMPPTSANSSPARFIFLQSQEAKQRLKPALAVGNIDKTMSAPVTVIVAQDMEFYEQLPRLFPQADARSWFAGNANAIQTTASRNSSLQGAYFILAARALGLDCGPMSGFDNAKVDAEFFADKPWKSNFLINLGYGDAQQLHPRNPRLDFEDACQIL